MLKYACSIHQGNIRTAAYERNPLMYDLLAYYTCRAQMFEFLQPRVTTRLLGRVGELLLHLGDLLK